MRSEHRHGLKGTVSSLRTWQLGVLLLAAAILGCSCASAPPYNYLEYAGPRYAGSFRSSDPVVDGERTFLVTSFNVKLGAEPGNALKVLRNAGFDQPDLLLLQEMDPESTIEIAASLGYNYVYYPAAIHPSSRRQFGVAILSPWPIQHDHKIVLPDFADSRDPAGKAAMAADDGVLTEVGLQWVPGIGRTYKYLFFGLGKLDHIYTSPTLEVEDSGQERGFFATGSDHVPIYARLRFNGEIPEPWQGFKPSAFSSFGRN